VGLSVKDNSLAAANNTRPNGIIFEEHRIPSDTAGIELYVRNKRPENLTEYRPETTIVMVHGATFSSGSLYDVPLGGYSFLDYLARAGFDVFAVDVRGYGLSTRPPEMEIDGSLNPPLAGERWGISPQRSSSCCGIVG
jgi:pimeloyl-ACP methyl ester carboxylesterase